MACRGHGGVAVGAAGEFEEGIEGVGVEGLVAALAVGGAEDLVDDRVERGVDEGTGVHSAAALDVPASLGVGPATQAALAVEAAVGGVGVGIGRGLGPAGHVA